MPSLDSPSAKLPSTPPIPFASYHPGHFSPDIPFHSTPHHHQQSQQQHQTLALGANPNYTDTIDAFGLKGDNVWLSDLTLSTPPSPSTIGSTSDSQTGGEYLPASDSAGDASDDLRSASTTHYPPPPPSNPNHNFRRHNLSLSIPPHSALPFQPSQASPSSLASSGALFTDSFSSNLTSQFGQDYFQFDEASLPSATEPSIHELAQAPSQPFAYRQPASQPTSPVRGVYQSGPPAFLGAGRQRGATFSGAGNTAQDFNPQFFFQHQQLQQAAQGGSQPIASAIPSHLAFTSIQASPVASPLSASPLLSASNPVHVTDYFDGSLNGQIKLDVSMEDVTTPVPLPTRRTSAEHATAELVNKLTLLDKIVSNAKNAKEALLRGEETEVSNNLGLLHNHLETASELNIGPSHTPRDTPSSNGVSPSNFQTSPTVQTNQNPAPVVSSLLPALPVENSPSSLRRVSPTAPTAANSFPPQTGDFVSLLPQAPPLTHSHSFPNGHQLPSQLHGLTAPTTPVIPSPSFTASLGITHAPVVSSPLATMPISRAPTPPRPYTIPEHPMGQDQIIPHDIEQALSRRPSEIRPDGRPVINRSRSASVTKPWSSLSNMTAAIPPSAWQSRQGSPEEADDDSDEEEGPRKNKRRRSSAGKDDAPDLSFQTGPVISEDIRRQLDQIFEEFLNRVCSDLEIVDNKGEKLHQVLMPKKMAKLNESTDFRPFKFRIQAFTNAFQDELTARGITEETMSSKKIKLYLWRQDLISRFNADGKKAKSKGNHIWNVDAKKNPDGGWVFRPFKRRIMGQPNAFALVGKPYEWEPRIWDPQAASETLKPVFRSPPNSLPSWLHWEDGTRLVGTPTMANDPVFIQTYAEFIDSSGNKNILETSFNLQVVPQHLMPNADPAIIFAQAQAQAEVEAQVLRNQANMYAQQVQQVQALPPGYMMPQQQWAAYPDAAMQAQANQMHAVQPMYAMPTNMVYPQPGYPQ